MPETAPDLDSPERAAVGDTAPPDQRARELSLAPFRRHLGLDGTVAEIPTSVELNGATMTLAPWERGYLATARSEADPGPGVRPVVECLAFLAKQTAQESLVTRFAQLSGSGDQFGSLVGELITDAAVGLAIQEDLQRTIEQVVASGRMDEAKQITSLRNRLTRQMTRLRSCIGDDGLGEAERLAQRMVAGPMQTLVPARREPPCTTGPAATLASSPGSAAPADSKKSTDSTAPQATAAALPAEPGTGEPGTAVAPPATVEQGAVGASTETVDSEAVDSAPVEPATGDEPAAALPAAGPPPAYHERQAALAPYRHYLALDADDAVETPSSLDIDGSPLPLEPWERQVLADVRSETESSMPRPELVLDGLTYLAKQIVHSSPGNPLISGDDLIVDVAVALALREEFQRLIDGLIASGRMEEAKHLSGLSNRVGRQVAAAKDRVGDDDLEAAETMASQMVPELAVTTSRTGDLSLGGAGVDARRARKRSTGRVVVSEPTGRRSSQRRRLGILLVASLLAWGIFILPRYSQPKMTVLEYADFGTINGIDTIRALPPSLFAVVNPRRWKEMSGQERLEVIERLGTVAEQHGYSGAHVTDPDGVAVAKWLRQGGARVIGTRSTP